jgi:hypothetical protein
MSYPISEKILHEAIDRVARTHDGRMLYLFLQRRLMAVCTAEADSALRINEGERTFASKLIGLMAKGISEGGGRTSSDGDTGGAGSDQPIIFAVARPIAVGGSRGAGRRIDERTRVPGYDLPDRDDEA